MFLSKEEIGRQASIVGFANEKIACGILMKKYANVSLVDLPLSSYDIVIVRKIKGIGEDILRVQCKTAQKDVKFTGGARGGVDRTYKSGVKTYIQSQETSDCVVGVHCKDNGETDLYFVPTILIEKLKQGSISLSKINRLKNNYEVLENCKDAKYVLAKAKEYKIIN